MADEDIYGNKHKYEEAQKAIALFAMPVHERAQHFKKENGKPDMRRAGKYVCNNKKNLPLFNDLFAHFDAQDISYVRRNRVLSNFKAALHHTPMRLSDIEKNGDRKEIDRIVTCARKTMNNSIEWFIKDLQYIWGVLFPVRDDKGRIDETQTPYVVRHLKATQDRSKRRLRHDRMTVEEYLRILDSFSDDARIQAFIALAYESLGRPQEILGVKVGDVKLYENYAKIYAGKGKEGPGLLRCVDSYPYIVKLLSQHPLRSNPEAFLFLNVGQNYRYEQMGPKNINKMLRKRCALLKIDKPITCYSFKRNGVSDRRLRGDSDKEIQATARWTTTKQLHTYDITGQEEAFMNDLIRRGIVKPTEATKHLAPATKSCPFCDAINQAQERTCHKCKRLLYRQDIEAEQRERETENVQLKEQLTAMQARIDKWDKLFGSEALAKIIEETRIPGENELDNSIRKNVKRKHHILL